MLSTGWSRELLGGKQGADSESDRRYLQAVAKQNRQNVDIREPRLLPLSSLSRIAVSLCAALEAPAYDSDVQVVSVYVIFPTRGSMLYLADPNLKKIFYPIASRSSLTPTLSTAFTN